jgi:hypothetical protein
VAGCLDARCRADLIAACAAAGIGVVGPDFAAVRKLADAARSLASLQGLRPCRPAPRRRVEVDILADGQGTVWLLGLREVSVRDARARCWPKCLRPGWRRNWYRACKAAAVQIAQAVGYRGAGVLGFVHDGERFQVVDFDTAAPPLHATTEERTGISIIGWRLRIHQGQALPPVNPRPRVWPSRPVAAESSEAGPVAKPGRIAMLSFPVGTGVRIDANRRAGDRVDADDPLVAVLTSWGPDRSVALARMRRALERTAVVIEGGGCNRTLLLNCCGTKTRPAAATRRQLAGPGAGRASAVAAGAGGAAGRRRRSLCGRPCAGQVRVLCSRSAGSPRAACRGGHAGVVLSYGGTRYRSTSTVSGRGSTPCCTARCGPTSASTCWGRTSAASSAAGACGACSWCPPSPGYRIETESGAHHVEREDGVVVRAGWPALVVAVHVRPGMQGWRRRSDCGARVHEDGDHRHRTR